MPCFGLRQRGFHRSNAIGFERLSLELCQFLRLSFRIFGEAFGVVAQPRGYLVEHEEIRPQLFIVDQPRDPSVEIPRQVTSLVGRRAIARDHRYMKRLSAS